MTFCASSTVGALLPRANNSRARFISSCFQVLIIVGWMQNSDDSSARVFSPDSAAIGTRALNSALCCFLFTLTSHASLDRSALSLSDYPKNRGRRTCGLLHNSKIMQTMAARSLELVACAEIPTHRRCDLFYTPDF